MYTFSKTEQMIMLKMVDQKRSDFYVVFTMIICGLNLCVLQVMKLKFTDQLQKTAPGIYLWLETCMTSDIKVTNVSINLSAQRITATFSVIVYLLSRTK